MTDFVILGAMKTIVQTKLANLQREIAESDARSRRALSDFAREIEHAVTLESALESGKAIICRAERERRAMTIAETIAVESIFATVADALKVGRAQPESTNARP
jgi:hypothetical protein